MFIKHKSKGLHFPGNSVFIVVYANQIIVGTDSVTVCTSCRTARSNSFYEAEHLRFVHSLLADVIAVVRAKTDAANGS